MLVEPAYASDIIVGTIRCGVFRWYVTGKDNWYMDKCKRKEVYIEYFFEGKTPQEDYNYGLCVEDRGGIEILNNDTVVEFMKRIEKNRVETSELRDALKSGLKKKTEYDVFFDFRPSLLLNFDDNTLFSIFPEPEFFEDYVPEKWRGEERNFLWEIPQKERFWHDGDELILDLYTANGVVNNG